MKTEMTRSPQYHGFFAGVLSTQFVNSALHLVQPLLIAELTGSLAHAAFFSAFDTAIHMFGTFVAGWPTDRFGARQVLIAATLLRACALGAIPILMGFGCLTIHWAMFWYTVDALVRGFIDAAEYSLPMELVGRDLVQLDRINSRFELVFDFGGVVGPLMLGALMVGFNGIVAHIVIPIGFAVSAAAYLLIPRSPVNRGTSRKVLRAGGTWTGFRSIFRDRALLISCIGIASFNVYPLRKLLGAFFAKSILLKAASVGIIGSSFGVGGIVGALIYTQRKSSKSNVPWIFCGACGMIVLAVGWVPANLNFMAASAFVFALTNVGARLALVRIRQEATPLEVIGGVTAASRFAANGISVLLKSVVGMAFAFGLSARAGFAWVSLILGAIALGQMILAGYYVQVSRRRTVTRVPVLEIES